MLIPVAMQEARQVARTIADMVHNGGASAFRYRDPGIMATIGRNSGVAQLGRVHLSGFLGWGMWLVVHLVNVVELPQPHPRAHKLGLGLPLLRPAGAADRGGAGGAAELVAPDRYCPAG